VTTLTVGRARLGYVPYSPTLLPPGDRRRFANWARSRGVSFELAHPDRSYDIVVLSARADLSRWARRRRDGTRIVYDLIDSYLTIPPWRPDDIARGLGKTLLRQHARPTLSYTRAVIEMCGRADVVVCSTPEQRERIRSYCDDVRVILDVHDDELQPVSAPPPDPTALRLFWEGLPQNLAGFQPAALDALATVHQQVNVTLHVVTDPTYRRWFGRVGTAETSRLLRSFPVPTVLHPWDTETVPAAAGECDIGLIPLDLDDAFAAGKPENKLLIMWQLGLPVVTSATPSYRRVMSAAGLSDVCTTTSDWAEALLRLREPATRQQAARAGLSYVRDHHAGEAIRQDWDRLITDLLEPRESSLGSA
jgi:glycosyltransferase involved in cell wall biosynthesis